MVGLPAYCRRASFSSSLRRAAGVPAARTVAAGSRPDRPRRIAAGRVPRRPGGTISPPAADRAASCPLQRLQQRLDGADLDLQVEPPPQRPAERTVRVEGTAQADLVEHQLRVAELQEGKAFLRSRIGHGKVQQVAIEVEAFAQRLHGQFGNQGIAAQDILPMKKARIAPGLQICSMGDADYSAASAGAFSLPVAWSTTFIERRTLPRSSKPSSFTQTLSPSLTTSVVLLTRFSASWEMCTSPSLEPKKLTKAPKSAVFTTVPW